MGDPPCAPMNVHGEAGLQVLTSQSRNPGGRRPGRQSRARIPKMAAAKDSCGKGEMATGNGRRLHLGIPEAVFVVRGTLFPGILA